jgi:hypothetical protein
MWKLVPPLLLSRRDQNPYKQPSAKISVTVSAAGAAQKGHLPIKTPTALAYRQMQAQSDAFPK